MIVTLVNVVGSRNALDKTSMLND